MDYGLYPGKMPDSAGIWNAPDTRANGRATRYILALAAIVSLLTFGVSFSFGVSLAASGPLYPPRPEPPRLVNDFAGMLSPAEREGLESQLLELNSRTSVQFAVVTIKSLGGVSIEEYAVKLFEKWGIGEKGKDNGLLLLIARDDREMRFEVGYGLEGVLPDAFCGRVIDEELVPGFAAGDYVGGIRAAVSAIGSRLEGSGEFAPGGSRATARKPKRQDDLIPALIALTLILFFVYSGNKRRQNRNLDGDGGVGRLPRPIFTPGQRNPQGGGGRKGGGFGGFGGGRSGGGGASGKW